MTGSPTVTLDAHSTRRSLAVWSGLLYCGLLLPPLVWAIQLYLNFGLGSHACYPNEAPRATFVQGWERTWSLLLVVNLLCAAICAIGLLASGYSWQRLRDEYPGEGKVTGAAYPSQERLRSFAVAGAMMSAVFTAAILFDTIYLWALSTCSQA
jgi:hypothetical protein